MPDTPQTDVQPEDVDAGMPEPQRDENGNLFLTLTDGFAKKVNALVGAEGNPELKLRVIVSGGGCSGFQYGFDLDSEIAEDDVVFEHGGASLVIDETSLELMSGAEVDYKEDLIGSYFAITNPLASSTCGCGTSFSI